MGGDSARTPAVHEVREFVGPVHHPQRDRPGAGGPISGWMSAIQFAKVRATLEMRGKMGNLEVSFGYQTADVTSSPDTAVGIGAYITADGMGNPSAWTDLSAITPGKQYIRFVLLTRNSSGTTTNLARIGAVMDYYGF